MEILTYKINTSNLGKFKEFKHLFAKYGVILEPTHFDLREIDAEAIEVVCHKASQLENTIVEDTSLEIEEAQVGINIRWLLDHLPDYIGRKAEWVVLMAIKQNNTIFIYKGSVLGSIVKAKGTEGFGFDPVFLPEGATETLAESKPEVFNARAKAIEALMKNNVWKTHPVIENWEGSWQDS